MHSFLDRQNLDAPPPEIAEISIFGNGYGECLVIHLGYNEWAIFDSCLNPRSSRPAPLEYLQSIKVDPSERVKLFLISHWHADHIRGGAEIFRQCGSAWFSCSNFFSSQQMLQLIDPRNEAFQKPLAVHELANILAELEARSHDINLWPRSMPRWALQNRTLFRMPRENASFSAEIHSLSPFDADMSRFLAEIALLLPKEREAKKELLLELPNAYSVVTWISIGRWNILLGADLEQTSDTTRGWNAILFSQEKPQGKAQIIKVPHHGSRNAHNNLVWRDMVQGQAIALLSPFGHGNVNLPTEDDVRRICTLTPNSYCAAQVDPIQPRRRSPAVERQLKEMAIERRVIGGRFGQVRVRFNPLALDEPEVALIDQANHLCPN